MTQGLSSEKAGELLEVHGYNELISARPKSVFRIAAEVIKEPMFLLLIACGTLYLILGDIREGLILLASIFLIIFITFYQYRKTEAALDALKRLSSPRALVIRDGATVRIPGREVVPGDVLLLNEGDRVAADARLLESTNLTVDESLLTGESLTVTKDPDLPDEKVFSGTLVVQGKGTALVTATGMETEFGKIGRSLNVIESDQTRLQVEMRAFVRRLFMIGALVSLVIVAAFYITRGDLVRSLLSGLAAAMSILPEEFPVVLTIFMALGAWRLSKINVLTRRPSAIETLGSATVLCTDKTGTLTQNKMAVVALSHGGNIFERNNFEGEKESIGTLVKAARCATQEDSPDPMELAVCELSALFGRNDLASYRLVKEYPLSPALPAMTRVLEDENEGDLVIACKGAPEAVFKLCGLSTDETAKEMEAVNHLATQGRRVLAAAKANAVAGEDLPAEQSGFRFEYIGLLAFEDPIRPEVKKAARECYEAGIKVVMITGDFPATARSIGGQVGLDPNGKTMTGAELAELSDDELRNVIEGINVFARVVPEQKLRIVNAFKANKEIVAMTGDGVNDAPALKAAHIGIAMGQKGTDVAREASSLVLLDDNFASVVAAIRHGRRIYDNLQKAMAYIIAIHIPIIGLALLPAFFPWLPILLLPLHIVFLELIIDPACSIAFENEQDEKGIMQRPPRAAGVSFFGPRKLLLSVTEGLLLLVMVAVVYFLSIDEGHTEGEVRAIAFSTLVIGNVFLILTNLNKTRSFVASLMERNIAVLLIVAAVFLSLVIIFAVPAVSSVFSFQFPGTRHLIPALIGASAVLAILEAYKLVKARYRQGRYRET